MPPIPVIRKFQPSSSSAAVDSAPDADEQDDQQTPEDDPVEATLNAAEIPGTEQQQECRRQALRATYEYLREHGTASKSDFADDIYPDSPGRYSKLGGAWWRKVIRPNLDAFPGVVKPSGGGAWEYVDEE